MDKNIVEKAHKLLEKDRYFAINAKAYRFYNYFDVDSYALEKSAVCDDDKIKDKTTISVCRKLEKILNEWEGVMVFANSVSVDEKTTCDYLIYWLYDKVKNSSCDDSDIYLVYSKLSDLMESICFKEKKDTYDRKFIKLYDRNVLKNKKELHDFLEYYNFIRPKLDNENLEKTVYCNYIEYIFGVYNKMHKDYNLKCTGLYEEITPFKQKFNNSSKELNYVKEKCQNISEKLVSEVKNEIICLSQEQENEKERKRKELKKKLDASIIEERITIVESSQGKKEKIKLDDDISEKLPSLKIYEELNNDNNIDLNNSYCKNLEINEEKSKKICGKIVKNFKRMVELDNQEQHNEYCLHFVHWIYDEIKNNFGINSNFIYKTPDIIKLSNVQFPINNELSKYGCYYNFNSPINEMKEKTELLDYFQIFDRINNDTTCVNDKCKKNCKYFENINTLYNKHRRSCCTRFHYGAYFDNCLDYFKCDNKYNPKTFISKLKCQIEKSNENTEELDEYTSIDENVILKSLKSLSLVNSPKIKCDGLMCDTFSVIMSFFFSILGILLLLFLFYKVDRNSI
ncbi:Plasmodium vivax Vir protein, putative [Plasmodium ovale]|uniref:Plasmodium vivax Vir protein, putative n=1 Tax=Plasmodium ovale TaxID=36330 RepID=A0A1C3KIB0_PLAOA|nr:Plasmodium vivax Vir protein, putative [Plasmodium ovale]